VPDLDVLYMGIRGETIMDLSQRLLGHHGELCELLNLAVAELALRDGFLSQRPSTRGPGRSTLGASPGRSC